MKIVIIQGAFFPVPPLKGGAVEKRWFQLSKEFAKHGHEVIHLSKEYKNLPNKETIEGVSFRRKSGFNFHSNKLISNFYDFLYSYKITRLVPDDADVIVTNSFWSPVLLKKTHRRKTIVDVARMPKGQMKFYKGIRFYRANSTPVAEAIKNEVSEVKHHMVKTIPNPLTFKTNKIENTIDKEKLILYTGRIHPEKGIHLLIQSFNDIATKDWNLVLLGSYKVSEGGGGEKYLMKLKSMVSKNNVEILNPIYDINKLNEYYQRSSIFVYPSLAEKGETFGLSPLEAMAWGSVPIVSDLTCFKDFIKNGSNGLIFNHRAKDRIELLSKMMLKLILDNEKRNKMSQKAIKVRDSHSIENIGAQFLNMFALDS